MSVMVSFCDGFRMPARSLSLQRARRCLDLPRFGGEVRASDEVMFFG